MRKCISLLAFLLAALCLLSFGCPAEEAVLRDGVYTPDSFEFFGGTGKVTLSCPEVTLSEGAATAKIVFSSPKYTEARLGDERYTPEYADCGAVFTLPVPLNRAFHLFATTTAMSAPHEIEYQLYIGLGGNGLPGLVRTGSMPLRYAEGFSVDYYEGGFALISIRDGGRYLVIPEGLEPPEGLDPAITPLRRPLDRIYLAATSAMSLFDALDSLDRIRFSSLHPEDWSIPAAAEAMESGSILFAGKYDKPDYESLVREGCDLAIESTMISHSPKIRELLELLGIPVLVDRSSYESHPLGRTEWIRLYAVLLGKEAEAGAFFAEQADSLSDYENSGKTVAFFYISSNGTAVVRNPSDYIPRMINMAGGVYVPQDIPAGGQAAASIPVSMEDFYSMAGDADVLIYNAAIDTAVGSLRELTQKNGILSDFKAVKEGNAWCAENNLYQATSRVTGFIRDVHRILTGDTGGCEFLRPLK